MEVSPLNRNVQAVNLPLERLAGSTQVSEREKVHEVSRQFEAILLRQILSQAAKPLFKSALVDGDGASSSIYQDMITQQLADRISQGGSFGFAKVLEKQLGREHFKPAEPLKAEPFKATQPLTGTPHPKTISRPQPGKRI